MRNFVKWIGAGIGYFVGVKLGDIFGWEVGGPAGGIIGFIVGTVIDSLEIRLFRKSNKENTMGEFATNLLMVIAAVLKADEPIVKQQLDNVKIFLKQNFAEKEASKALILLRKILKQQIPLTDACAHVRPHLDYSSRLQLTHFLHKLATVNGQTSTARQNILNIVNIGLHVTMSDRRTVGVSLAQTESINAAYSVLGIHPSSSIIHIKKAYRTLAAKYHPDKVAFLGEEARKTSNEKFQQLSRAYEIIKKERGFS